MQLQLELNAIKNKNNEFMQTIKAKEHEIKKKEHEMKEKDKKLKKANEKVFLLNEFIRRTKPREKTQKFYIVTSKTYAKSNRFKFGGVDNQKQLINRLERYNSKRPAGDKMYYVFIRDVYNYKTLENRIYDVLPKQFKDDENEETIHCHFEALIKIIEFIIEIYDEEVEFINKFIQTIYDLTCAEKPIIPNPISVNI